MTMANQEALDCAMSWHISRFPSEKSDGLDVVQATAAEFVTFIASGDPGDPLGRKIALDRAIAYHLPNHPGASKPDLDALLTTAEEIYTFLGPDDSAD